MTEFNLGGVWTSTRYSRPRAGKIEAIDLVGFKPVDGLIMAESLPNDEGSELTMELELDEDILAGEWRRRTPAEELTGRLFLKMSPDFTEAKGVWVGKNPTAELKMGGWVLKQELAPY